MIAASRRVIFTGASVYVTAAQEWNGIMGVIMKMPARRSQKTMRRTVSTEMPQSVKFFSNTPVSCSFRLIWISSSKLNVPLPA